MLTQDSTLNDILGTPSGSEQAETFEETEKQEISAGSTSTETLNTGEEEATEVKGAKDDDRFDKHPRWQERQRQLEDERLKSARLEAELSAYKTMADKKEEPKKESPAYRDITAMSDDELAEVVQQSPKKFATDLYLQLREELTQEIGGKLKDETAKERQERTLKEEYKLYEGKYPDFREMWDSGKIQKYMEDHPGHTPKSAHMEMTYDTRLTAAKQEAAAAKEKELNANRQAKKKAGTLGAGPPAPVKGGATDPRLLDSKAHGGLFSVLAQRHAARRAS